MPNSIFISYRRLDSQHATFAIANRLSWAFGADEVFFDRGSIRAGNQWPDALERGLNAAKVLVLIAGKAWLTAIDKWARSRIDDPADWVRREILAASRHSRQDVPRSFLCSWTMPSICTLMRSTWRYGQSLVSRQHR